MSTYTRTHEKDKRQRRKKRSIAVTTTPRSGFVFRLTFVSKQNSRHHCHAASSICLPFHFLCSYHGTIPLYPAAFSPFPRSRAVGCTQPDLVTLRRPPGTCTCTTPYQMELYCTVPRPMCYQVPVIPLGAPCSCMLHSLSLARHQQSVLVLTRTGGTARPSMEDCMYMLPPAMPVPVHARGHPLKTPPLLFLSPPAKAQCREFFFSALGHRLTLLKLPLLLGKEKNQSHQVRHLLLLALLSSMSLPRLL